uniref:Uncharacterized protein n=1 Tax=Arundo donax TaxID=35708 RepID=A0A0A8YAV7_ARUDO
MEGSTWGHSTLPLTQSCSMVLQSLP